MSDKIVYLKPEQIVAEDNIRYGMKKDRLESLKSNILKDGRVLQNVIVNEPVQGKYKLVSGFYRHAAVTQLNSEGGDLQIPAMIIPKDDNIKARRETQLAENRERENMSPMDIATAIVKMEEEGFTPIEIRQAFPRKGGRKGGASQPASPSFISMHKKFLEFTKPVRDKIHEGVYGVGTAYQLLRVKQDNPDKFDSVLEKIESDRLKELEREETDEAKFLELERKEAEAQEKAAKLEEDLAKASEAAKQAAKETEELAERVAAASKARVTTDKDAKAKAEAEFKEAEAAMKKAAKASEQAEKERAKLEAEAAKQTAKAKEQADKAKAAKAEAKVEAAKSSKVRGSDVKKAAAQQNASSAPTKLSGKEMYEVATNLCLPGSFPKVRQIGEILKRCFDCKITEQQMYKELALVTGEKKEKK